MSVVILPKRYGDSERAWESYRTSLELYKEDKTAITRQLVFDAREEHRLWWNTKFPHSQMSLQQN